MVFVDTNSIAARAFFATHKGPGPFREPDFVGAFLRSLLYSLDFVSSAPEGMPSQADGGVVLCLDSRSWRKDYYSQYKANRDEMKSRIPWSEYNDCLLEVCAAMKVALPFWVLRKEPWEADDLLAWLVKREWEYMQPFSAVVVSSDKDLLQLASDRCFIYNPVRGHYVKPEGGVDLFVHTLTCVGDSSDNVPSLAPVGMRLGEKTVAKYFVSDGFHCNMGQEFWEKLSKKDEEDFVAGYLRNRVLVDLSLSPVHQAKLPAAAFGKYDPDAVDRFFDSRMRIADKRKLHYLMQKISV